jgi:epoxyqueuosine reductase
MMSIERSQLSPLIAEAGFSTWGVADITGLHPLAQENPSVLSVGMSYVIPFARYDEASYYALTVQVRTEFDRRFSRLQDFLTEAGLRHLVPGSTPHDPTAAVPVFPHKLAAARAGLGWIGKSTLLVTPEFGPRVRLGSILFAEEIEADPPVTESRCGSCDHCYRACPNDAISNELWSAESARTPHLSAAQCGKRESFVATLGRKHACGHCLLVCPVGNSGICRRV